MNNLIDMEIKYDRKGNPVIRLKKRGSWGGMRLSRAEALDAKEALQHGIEVLDRLLARTADDE